MMARRWSPLHQISVRSKLVTGFALALTITLGLGSFAIDRLNAVERAAADLRDGALRPTLALSRIDQPAESLRSAQELLVIAVAEERRTALLTELETQAREVQAAVGFYRLTVAPGEAQALAGKLGDDRAGSAGHQTGLFSGRMLKAMHQLRGALRAARRDGRRR